MLLLNILRNLYKLIEKNTVIFNVIANGAYNKEGDFNAKLISKFCMKFDRNFVGGQ
jgi:hypothetical protein